MPNSGQMTYDEVLAALRAAVAHGKAMEKIEQSLNRDVDDLHTQVDDLEFQVKRWKEREAQARGRLGEEMRHCVASQYRADEAEARAKRAVNVMRRVCDVLNDTGGEFWEGSHPQLADEMRAIAMEE